MSAYNITALPTTLVEVLWSRIAPSLSLVVSKLPNELDISAIKDKAVNGDILIVIVSQKSEIIAAITLEIKVFDSGLKVMYIPAIGGTDFFEWEDDLFNAIKGLSRLYECTEIRAVAARLGWHKLAKTRQWEEVYTTFKFKL